MSELTDYEIVQAMERFGGSFVKALSLCWQKADIWNQSRLKAAFPELWADYAGIVERQKAREAAQ